MNAVLHYIYDPLCGWCENYQFGGTTFHVWIFTCLRPRSLSDEGEAALVEGVDPEAKELRITEAVGLPL